VTRSYLSMAQAKQARTKLVKPVVRELPGGFPSFCRRRHAEFA
jgi:hypothetical protein